MHNFTIQFTHTMTALEKGKSLFDQQKYEEAIDCLSQFLCDHENNADALFTRALCFRKTTEFEKSIKDFSAILDRLPDEATIFSERGVSYFHNKNIESAIKDMDRAVELEPNNPFRYSSRAFIKGEIDVNGAMLDYEKAIELDPKDEISYNNLGLLQENSGQIKAAKKNYKKSNRIIGYDPDKRKLRVEHEKEQRELNSSPDSLLKVMLSVFKSKKVRQEYWRFLKSKFKK